jgi:SAM-dependent methyltransferase
MISNIDTKRFFDLKKLIFTNARIIINIFRKSHAFRLVQVGWFYNLIPKDKNYGFNRGTPIDRYYIENFLKFNAAEIKGHVLEIGDNSYTKRFGGDQVTRSDVLHVNSSNPNATIVGDLAYGDNIPSDSFDCLVITQTLQLIYDFHSAIRTMHRILKPGGVALVTFPGLSQMADDNWNPTWYWGFTRHSAKKMFGEVFSENALEVAAFGNVLTTVSFLKGIASEELSLKDLSYRDPAYDLVICVKVSKEKLDS